MADQCAKKPFVEELLEIEGQFLETAVARRERLTGMMNTLAYEVQMEWWRSFTFEVVKEVRLGRRPFTKTIFLPRIDPIFFRELRGFASPEDLRRAAYVLFADKLTVEGFRIVSEPYTRDGVLKSFIVIDWGPVSGALR